MVSPKVDAGLLVGPEAPDNMCPSERERRKNSTATSHIFTQLIDGVDLGKADTLIFDLYPGSVGDWAN